MARCIKRYNVRLYSTNGYSSSNNIVSNFHKAKITSLRKSLTPFHKTKSNQVDKILTRLWKSPIYSVR